MMWLRYSRCRCVFSSSPKSFFELFQQVRSQFSRNSFVRKRHRSGKNVTESDALRVESVNESHPIRLLIRPTIFTIGFVGCSFVTCAIWQYESHRHKLTQMKQHWQIKEKPTQMSSQLRSIWKDLSESQRVIGSVIGFNLIVFLLWRVKRFEGILLKYFTSSPFKSNLTSMLLSTFSHHSGIHFVCNMYVLYSFTDPIVKILGKEQFFAVFVSGGVVSSWLSYLFKILTRTTNISVGASGSIMCLIGAICTQYPDAKLSIIFLPLFTFSAKSGVIGIMAFDLLGIVMRWRLLDHSAHIGGLLFGIFYVKFGYKMCWESLKPIVECWHRFREKWK